MDLALGLLLRKTSSTPAVVPGAAPALAKAGVGGYIYIYINYILYIYICNSKLPFCPLSGKIAQVPVCQSSLAPLGHRYFKQEVSEDQTDQTMIANKFDKCGNVASLMSLQRVKSVCTKRD